jgi:hypothetical protein
LKTAKKPGKKHIFPSVKGALSEFVWEVLKPENSITSLFRGVSKITINPNKAVETAGV